MHIYLMMLRTMITSPIAAESTCRSARLGLSIGMVTVGFSNAASKIAQSHSS